jgi:hypothetical protein
MMARNLTEFEDRRAVQLVEVVEAAEDAFYRPNELQKARSREDRKRELQTANDDLSTFLTKLANPQTSP